MVFWVNQAIVGFTLLIGAFSMWRMGPAFKRSQFARPIAALGLIMLLLLPEQPLYFEPDFHRCVHLSFCNDDGRESFLHILQWTLFSIAGAFLGCYTIIQASGVYSGRKPPLLLLGWIILGGTWWSISQSPWFIEAYTRFDVLTMMFATLVGIGLTVYLFFHVIRFTERRTPKDPPIAALDERERRLVTEMIRRNLGGDE